MCTLQVELLDTDVLELPCESSTVGTELHLNSWRSTAYPPPHCPYGKLGIALCPREKGISGEYAPWCDSMPSVQVQACCGSCAWSSAACWLALELTLGLF